MAQYYPQQTYPKTPTPQSAQNLQFQNFGYPSIPVPGHTTPSLASYGGYGASQPNPASTYAGYGVGAGPGYGGAPAAQSVSGRMGEQGGLRTGWLAAFGTEGYDGEPPLLEELGVNFGHIRTKVSCANRQSLTAL